jgi:hypothetical protein
MGIDFSICNAFLFAVGFKDCTMDHSLHGRKLKKYQIQKLFGQRSRFLRADLSGAVF